MHLNILRLFIALLFSAALMVSGDLDAQNSDIHSAQVIKEKLHVVRIADSLSGFQYTKALKYCLNEISLIEYADKPDLYSDLMYKAGAAAFQIGEVTLSDSLMEEILSLRIRNIHPILQAQIILNKLRAASFFGRKIEAIRLGKEGLSIFKKNENIQGQIDINIGMGSVYLSMNRLDISLEYFNGAIKIAKKLGDKLSYGKSLVASIEPLIKMGREAEIKDRLVEIQKFYEELNNTNLEAEVANVTGRFLYSQKDYNHAINYFDLSIVLYSRNNKFMQMSNNYTWKAAVAMRLEKYQDAADNNLIASSLRKKADSYIMQASSQYNIANSYIHLKKYDSALYYIRCGEEFYQHFKHRPDYVRGMDLQRKIYIERNEYDLAFFALERKMRVQDSLFQMSNKLKLEELESDFAMEKFEKTKEKLIAASRIQKMENKRNGLILNFVLVVLFLVLVSSILVFVHIKSKNRRDIILVSQRLIFIQMNSHFVFNALTAIQSLIYKKQLESAIHYLTIFSSLINKITGDSQKKYTTLQTEVAFVIEFLQIQQLRFGKALNYRINIDDDMNLQNYRVPPMLIYPFIEYAVEECVQKAEKGGELIINILKEGKYIVYEIVDKGLGFINMDDCFIKRYGGQEILCEQLTRERISIYNHFFNSRIIFAEKNVFIDGKEHKALRFRIKK